MDDFYEWHLKKRVIQKLMQLWNVLPSGKMYSFTYNVIIKYLFAPELVLSIHSDPIMDIVDKLLGDELRTFIYRKN